MKKILLLLLALPLSLLLTAQERQGFGLSRYGGMNGLAINPSFGMLTPFQLEAGWSMAGLNLDNYFLHVPDARLDEFLFGTGGRRVSLINRPGAGFHGEAVFRFPAVGVKFRRFAVSTVAGRRLVFGFEQVPAQFLQDIFNGYDSTLAGQEREIPAFHGGYLAWEEAGANFSAVLQQYENDRIHGGLSLRLVHGASGAFFSTGDQSVYRYTDSSSVLLRQMNAYYGQNGSRYGAGLAFDIGLNWMKQDTGRIFRSVETPGRVFNHQYKYHLGVSLLDVGMVRFYEAEESDIRVQNLSLPVYGGGPYSADSLETLLTSLLERVDSAGTAATVQQTGSGTMDMRLPTAASLQFDWQFRKNFFLGSSFTYGLPVGRIPSIRRPSQLCLAPRYETEKVMVMLPLSFYDFRQARVGAALRIKGITVGTDRVFSYTKDVNSLKGFDVYVSVRLGITELEHTFLKPYQPVKEKHFEHSGYSDRLAALPGQSVQLYFSMHPDSGSLLVLTNFAGDTLDSTFVDPVQQRIRFWRPWKYGYGYRNVKRYKIPKNLPGDIYFLERETPLIVRSTAKDTLDILVVVPTNTFEAMNKKGGRSLYAAARQGRKAANTVSFLRPFDQPYFRQLAALNAWLKANPQYKVGYISDKEMDSYYAIRNAKLLIIAGESSHWTRDARSNYDRFLKKGGSVIVLSSGDFMKYQVRYRQKGKQLVCFKNSRRDLLEPDPLSRTGQWSDPRLKYPLPAYRNVAYPAASLAGDSALIIQVQGLSGKATVIDLLRSDAVKEQARPLKFQPEMFAELYFRGEAPAASVTVVKAAKDAGYVFDFHQSALLGLENEAQRVKLKTAIDFILAPQ